MRLQALSRLKLSLAVAAIPACVVLHSGNAKAVLVYELIPQGSDVQVKVSGSLTGLPAGSADSFGYTALLHPQNGLISYGSITSSNLYNIGPMGFGLGGGFAITGVTFGATQVGLSAWESAFHLSSSYVQGTPITASGLITGKSLATLGLNSTSGLLGTWTIGTDSIEVWAGAKPSGSPVPGPLPLLGAGAAFGYSRRLRSRLREASRFPQA